MIRDFSGCMGASATRVVGGSGGDVRAMEVFKTKTVEKCKRERSV